MIKEKKAFNKIRLPKKTWTIEFLVGIFTIIGALCFAYISINIGGMSFSDSGSYFVKAKFNSVSGLNNGAPVEIAGVPIGKVARVELATDYPEAIVTLKIDNGVELRNDDIAAVRTKGIIGDRYVKIIPGASDKKLKENSILENTESAVELEEILGKFIHSFDSE